MLNNILSLFKVSNKDNRTTSTEAIQVFLFYTLNVFTLLRKSNFPLVIFSVNETKCVGNCELVTFLKSEETLNRKLHFSCSFGPACSTFAVCFCLYVWIGLCPWDNVLELCLSVVFVRSKWVFTQNDTQ